ncbi:MAG: hypothetical protein GY866_40350 [Proteobacteria bacterium]|nr:hypothetical protein [Pseudomonadota bacterium]
MILVDRLSQNKDEIVAKWVRKAMGAYSTEAVTVLKRNQDQFANPLSHIISKNLKHLFDELLIGVDAERIAPFLDEVVRMKAVQDFTPSKALGFIQDLKDVLEEYLEAGSDQEKNLPELLTMEREIDKIALLSFDIYVSCREKLFEIRANEIRNQTHMLIRRVNEMDKQKEAR